MSLPHPARGKTGLQAGRLTLIPPANIHYDRWRDLREASRDHLTPWEPTWAEDALSRTDWKRHMKAWKAAWLDGRGYTFLIFHGADLIGGASLTNVRRGPAQMANLGYWQGAAHEGNGYMREAIEGLCTWAFRALGLCRIEAGTVLENARSRKLLESLGFQQEGLAAAYLEINGARRDHVLYGLVRSDFAA